MRIAPGEVIAQRYRLDAELARGGMGSVWTARHEALGAMVAIKFMDPRYADSPAARVRFEREARAAAQLQSAHVVRVFDYGIEDGTPFLVMELLHGEDLGARLARDGPFSLAAVAGVLAQVARALRVAHEAGIVHRDLKPGNVFLVQADGAEVAKVLDFGLAKTTEPLAGDEATSADEIIGSPQYMSPEQTRESREADPRSDLWALGVIAYRLLTGRLPFTGKTASDVLVKVCTEPAPPPSRHVPGLPPRVDGFFERALAKEPDERFQSAPELARAFALAAGLPDVDREPTAPVRAPVAAPAPAPAPVAATAPVLPPAPKPPPRSALPMLLALAAGLCAVAVGVVIRQRSIGQCSPADAGACRMACLLASAPDCQRWHVFLCESPPSATDPARAEHCDTACKEGRATACAGLAEVLATRLGAEPESATGARAALQAQRLDALDRGCAAGDRAACLRLGVEGRDARALAALERTCAAQVPSACQALAARLAYGYAGAPPAPGEEPRFAREPARALALLQKGCAAGVLGDCEDAGALLLEAEGVPHDEALGRALFEKGAGTAESPPGGTPDERAQDAARRGVGLAWMLERGRGGPRDVARAARLVAERCPDPGKPGSFPASCLELAFLARTGRGVARDLERSKGILQRTCGKAFRCTDEARRREIGWLRPRDPERALAYYEMACTAGGEAEACTRLGTKMVKGDGAAVEPVRGKAWLREGCRGGDGRGCAALREMGEAP